MRRKKCLGGLPYKIATFPFLTAFGVRQTNKGGTNCFFFLHQLQFTSNPPPHSPLYWEKINPFLSQQQNRQVKTAGEPIHTTFPPFRKDFAAAAKRGGEREKKDWLEIIPLAGKWRFLTLVLGGWRCIGFWVSGEMEVRAKPRMDWVPTEEEEEFVRGINSHEKSCFHIQTNLVQSRDLLFVLGK